VYGRVFGYTKWTSVSLFNAGFGRFNFCTICQCSCFKTLLKFILRGINVAKHLINCYLAESLFIENCQKHRVSRTYVSRPCVSAS
jgi:hypothetical protein